MCLGLLSVVGTVLYNNHQHLLNNFVMPRLNKCYIFYHLFWHRSLAALGSLTHVYPQVDFVPVLILLMEVCENFGKVMDYNNKTENPDFDV